MPAAGADDEAELPPEPGPARPGTAFVIDFDLAGFIAGLGIDCGNPSEQDAVAAAGQPRWQIARPGRRRCRAGART